MGNDTWWWRWWRASVRFDNPRCRRREEAGERDKEIERRSVRSVGEGQSVEGVEGTVEKGGKERRTRRRRKRW